MYQKKSSGWFKHIDFMLLDLLCIQIAFYLSYIIRQRGWNPYIVPTYRNMAIFIELADMLLIFLFDSYDHVLKRGYYIEFVSSVKQAIMMILVASLYLFSMKAADEYSRIILYLTGIIYCIFTYVTRIAWKKYLNVRMKTGGDCSLFIITTSEIAEKTVQNIKEHNYEMYQINGIIVLDQDMTGEMIEGIPVVSDAKNAAEILCQMWVDEVFINLDEKDPYPEELIERCTEMGITVHFNLAKLFSGVSGKKSVGKVGEYTVLTASINMMSSRDAAKKRIVDIIFGIAGCIATGIIFIFIAPAIYISSPGPIFFAQERVGQNGKMFKMYKFRSMYMDAEKRKAELMKSSYYWE